MHKCRGGVTSRWRSLRCKCSKSKESGNRVVGVVVVIAIQHAGLVENEQGGKKRTASMNNVFYGCKKRYIMPNRVVLGGTPGEKLGLAIITTYTCAEEIVSERKRENRDRGPGTEAATCT
ncbi:hypothetical protein KQX54_021199 [Cotesia glomerata]|uniref:Uncharacterized protein n=1 Tax=Cotesia glomerata TaxID=32391 RepID=A0AAV7J6S1_COTGL|nr:hypothetical protein KQX54_021199 [Cotesia glomerata]